MKRSILLTAMICASASAQAAEPETYTVKVEQTSLVVLGAENETRAGYSTGKGMSTWADGKQTHGTNTCAFMTQPPKHNKFTLRQVCDVEDDRGTFSVIAYCNPPKGDPGAMSCVGELVGKTGAYAGRRGRQTSYGKGGKASIAGYWLPKSE